VGKLSDITDTDAMCEDDMVKAGMVANGGRDTGSDKV
jgi:hypothetical protein